MSRGEFFRMWEGVCEWHGGRDGGDEAYYDSEMGDVSSSPTNVSDKAEMSSDFLSHASICWRVGMLLLIWYLDMPNKRRHCVIFISPI